MIQNDLYCRACDYQQPDAWHDPADFPPCPDCGARMRTDFSHGKPPFTDVHEPRRYGEEIVARSMRDAESQMRGISQRMNDSPEWQRVGMRWEDPPRIDGDKRGGARSDTRPTGAAFGYAGQARRTSTGERKVA